MLTSADIRKERFINERRRTRGSHDAGPSSSQVIHGVDHPRPEHLFSAGGAGRECAIDAIGSPRKPAKTTMSAIAIIFEGVAVP